MPTGRENEKSFFAPSEEFRRSRAWSGYFVSRIAAGLVGVNPRRHTMTAIGLDRGGAAGKTREQDDRAKDGKKNSSHNLLV